MAGFRHVGDTEVHQGNVWNVIVADFEAPDGERFRRDIVRSPGSVGVLPLVFDAEGLPSVVLVSQFRPPYERDVIEIPAGMRDVDDEPAEETGRRELVEEAGLRAGRMELLCKMLPSPGMTDAVCSIFLATDCTPADHNRQGPEEHLMGVLHLPLADALTLVDRGQIDDAKTVIALLATERRLRA